jgi:transcriptional regulator with XRE-family HTH domain
MAKSELPALLRSIRDRFPSQLAFAQAIGVSSSRAGRVMKGQDSLNALSCLRLAAAAGEPPSRILRAANKGELADLLEQLYGRQAAAIPDTVRRTVAQLHGLARADRAAVEHLIARLATREPSGKRR